MNENYRKMLAGEPHNGGDAYLLDLQAQASERKAALDAISSHDIEGRIGAMQALLGKMDGPCMIRPPFTVEYGIHLHFGAFVFINSGATFLDSNIISIGSQTMVGPNAQFITATHPIRPEDRFGPPAGDRPIPFSVVNIAMPISIGEKCWIGAGAIIMPGVTIGDGTVVGAGAVVTKSLPARVVAVGSPARVIKSVDDA